MLCYVMLCYVMLCYVMLCYVMLCYVMLRYVVLLSILLLMVKLLLKHLLGDHGMLPVPAPVKVDVVVSRKKEKQTGNHSFHHFTHTFDIGVHSYGVHFQFQLETQLI